MHKANETVAKHLKEISQMYELLDDPQGIEQTKRKAFSYEKNAKTIEEWPIDISTIDPSMIKGIGPSTTKDIKQFLESGISERYQTLSIKAPPPSIVELTALRGVGPAKAKELFIKFGVKNLKEFGKAIDDKKITSKELIDAFEFNQRAGQRVLYSKAYEATIKVFNTLNELDEVKRLSFGGSLRRARPTVHDADLLCVATDKKVVTEWFLKYTEKPEDILVQGDTKVRILVKDFQIDLNFCEENEWGSQLFHITGSGDYNKKNRTYAKSKRLALGEHGLTLPRGEVISDTEENICKHLEIPYIVPELRDLAGMVDLPDLKLITKEDIKGDSHIHTSGSRDATGSVTNYAKAAIDLGYEYLIITDHGQGLPIAQISYGALEKQFEEIDEFNKRGTSLKVFKGIEANISPQGTLYFEDDYLKKFDYVVASIHSAFDKDEMSQTARLIEAIRHPAVKIIGHPDCADYMKREGIKAKWSLVFEECVKNNVALEVSGCEPRIGPSPAWYWRAKQAGVKFVLGTDSHSISALPTMSFALMRARRSGIEKSDLLEVK